jgi:hypothetical protein
MDQEHHGANDGFRKPGPEAIMRTLADSARMAAESFAEMMSRASERPGQAQKSGQSDDELEAEIMARLKRMDAEIDRLEANADRMLAAL